MGNYAGVDWASEKHDVDRAGRGGRGAVRGQLRARREGVAVLVPHAGADEGELVAIERPDGLLVERLLDAGLRLLPLHPNQVAAARARFRVSGGKSDRFDAFVLCELARTDHHRFRVLEPDSDQTKALRALTRAREDLVQTRVALSNQLRAELERFWPGPIGLFRDLDSPISLAFLRRYPSPARRRALGEKRLQAFLRRQRYSGRKPSAELLAKLRRAPEGRAGELECDARRAVVLSLVAALEDDRRADQAARARRSPPRCASIPTARSSPRCSQPRQRDHRGHDGRRDRRLPRTLPHRATRSPATPARPRSRSSPANARSRASAGRATSGCATRSARSPTAPATGTRGPPTTTPAPSPADTTTPAPSAPSAAPGAASCGAAGKTAPPMTRPATAACNSMSW